MLFDGIIVMGMKVLNSIINLLNSLEWPSFLDLSGYSFDFGYFSYFVPIGLAFTIITFLISYTVLKWGVMLLEIITRRRILP